MQGPKIAVIGAGSYFFGKPVIHKMATSPVMAGGTLALVDTDPAVLAVMMKLAHRVFAETGCRVQLTGDVDRRKVMRDADFIVLTFSARNAYFRGMDTRVAAKHGIRMCSSDTIGPGGIFRALREIPEALAVAHDAAELAPRAWVINFINPTAAIGMALARHAPNVRSFALCDGLHEPRVLRHWCQVAGIIPPDAQEVPPALMRRIDLAIGGVNHCTWLVRFRYDGRDMLPAVRCWAEKRMRAERRNPAAKAKPRYNAAYALQLLDLYGAYPIAVSHTKEYVPFYQGYGVKPVRPEPLKLFEADLRAREMAAAWRKTCDYSSGRLGLPEFLANISNDHATDIIESMWGGLNKAFYLNCYNRGAVSNLAPEAFLELRCDVDMRGPRPQPFGAMPPGLLGLTRQVLDTHELTAEAAVTGDRALLRRAMLTDPLCNNIADADACMDELLRRQRAVLPAFFPPRRRAATPRRR